MEQSKFIPLDLMSLSPQDAEFVLDARPGEIFTLRKWSIRSKQWAVEKYGTQALDKIFRELSIVEICDITWFMLKDQNKFKDQEDFLENVCSVRDQIAVIKALLKTVGIGEPELNKIDAAMKEQGHSAPPKKASPKKK